MLTCTSRLSVMHWWNIFVFFRSHNSASANQKAGKNAASRNVPSQWSSMPSDKQYRRVPLTSTSSEYKEIETLFKKTVNKSVVIKGIERVQNPFMWEKYQRYFILTNNYTMPGLILRNNTILNWLSTFLLYQHRKWREYPRNRKCVSYTDCGICPRKTPWLTKQYQIVAENHHRKCLVTCLHLFKTGTACFRSLKKGEFSKYEGTAV